MAQKRPKRPPNAPIDVEAISAEFSNVAHRLLEEGHPHEEITRSLLCGAVVVATMRQPYIEPVGMLREILAANAADMPEASALLEADNAAPPSGAIAIQLSIPPGTPVAIVTESIAALAARFVLRTNQDPGVLIRATQQQLDKQIEQARGADADSN